MQHTTAYNILKGVTNDRVFNRASAFGHISLWAHQPLGTSAFGHISLWAHLPLGTSAFGHISLWAHQPLGTSERFQEPNMLFIAIHLFPC